MSGHPKSHVPPLKAKDPLTHSLQAVMGLGLLVLALMAALSRWTNGLTNQWEKNMGYATW